MKLTQKQMSRFWRAWKFGEYHVAGKPEVRALERRGLVLTNEYGCTVITDAGRALLAEEKQDA